MVHKNYNSTGILDFRVHGAILCRVKKSYSNLNFSQKFKIFTTTIHCQKLQVVDREVSDSVECLISKITSSHRKFNDGLLNPQLTIDTKTLMFVDNKKVTNT